MYIFLKSFLDEDAATEYAKLWANARVVDTLTQAESRYNWQQ